MIHRSKVKKFFLDAALSCMFYVPIAAAWQFLMVKPDLTIVALTALGSLVVNSSTGGVYGRLLDYWRKKIDY